MDFHILASLSADAETPDPTTGPVPPSSITYEFGTGDGAVTSWSSVADLALSGDGVLDAVRLDFDGDGRADDAMWDTDGDGTADLAVIDTDDDATPDAHYSDTGRGLWDHRVTDVESPHPPHPDTRAPAAASPDDRRRPGRLADLDDDGSTDDRVIDAAGSGRAEIGLVFAGAADPLPARLLIDLDGDGTYDVTLIDDDADGRADVFAQRGQVRFDDDAARD